MKKFEYEQKHLDNVLFKIKQAQQINRKKLNRVKKGQKEIEKGWNDVRFSSTTYSGLFETAMSIRQQQQMLQEREMANTSVNYESQILERLSNNPYFARIDVEDKGDKVESIYIGLSSFSDQLDNFLIYDWRAPISSIYYDSGLGNVTYDTPEGLQQTKVNLKRQFQIKNKKIITIFDTDEVVGDQMLLDVVSGESSVKMKSIVATIQREQNKIIRNTSAELLFVQGAAGSGKTSSILQRIAYLLYRYRGNLTAGQVVMFSPNQLFNDYINQVLPEMGEQNMIQMTFYQYSTRRLPKLKLETLQERFEKNPSIWRQKINNFKGSKEYFDLVGVYTDLLNKSGVCFRNIKFRGRELISKKQIEKIYYSFNENYNLGQRLEGTKECLLNKINSFAGIEMKADWVEDVIQNLSKEEYDSILGDQVQEFKDEKSEYKFLAKVIVKNEINPILKNIKRTRFLNINDQFIKFLRLVPKLKDLEQVGITNEEWGNSLVDTISELNKKELNSADVTPFMYLFDLIKGSHGERDIRFVLIDEIQDYTPFQVAFLKFIFPKARFTILGDLNQAIFTKVKVDNFKNELKNIFEEKHIEFIQLTKTYRSTQQITEFAKAILVNSIQIEAFERVGPKPTIEILNNDTEMINAVLNQLKSDEMCNETMAIITRTLKEAEQIYEYLNDLYDITVIKTENQRLVSGVIVLPVYLAKGLEFDSVIMWDASDENYYRDDERQLVYTIVSRAMHKLTIIAKQKLSPLLNVSDNLYERK